MDQQSQLKKAGLNVTHPRIIVLEMFCQKPDIHLRAEDVYRTLLKNGHDIGLATVYRVLTQFEDAGIVTRHHFDGGKSVFELNNKPHHDHLICLICGKVIEFNDEIIEQRQHDIAARYHLQLTHHSLHLYGQCALECTGTEPYLG